MEWIHTIEMEVRDYELDLQGIVNNSVYLNYLEHGRHKCIQLLGLDFAELHAQGIDPVVVRTELDYKLSLRSGNTFAVRSAIELMGKLRFVFVQEIVRLPDLAVVAQARIIATTLRNGRPGPATELVAAIQSFVSGAGGAGGVA